jgi:N-acetylmuramic acid 6-phosphate (MurNAc-6-P) etherase
MELDGMSAPELVALFVVEEKRVAAALAICGEALSDAVEITTAALRQGGRLFYVGAGTSGRLGVLDASEIPPTFGTQPELVQGIIAGWSFCANSLDRGGGGFAGSRGPRRWWAAGSSAAMSCAGSRRVGGRRSCSVR